jgi:hypothetical protein
MQFYFKIGISVVVGAVAGYIFSAVTSPVPRPEEPTIIDVDPKIAAGNN